MQSIRETSGRTRRFAVGVTAVVCALAVPTTGSAQVSTTITAVRNGGTVLLCRHAITSSMREVEPVDYDDISTQRLLSPEGERQARRIGAALEALGIEVAEIVASPMSRARRTAELMFGRPVVIDSAWHTNGNDFSGPPAERRRRVLATPVASGNRLIVSHVGTMRSTLPRNVGQIGEGDCVVIRPEGDTFTVLGVVPWRAWTRAAPGPEVSAHRSPPTARRSLSS